MTTPLNVIRRVATIAGLAATAAFPTLASAQRLECTVLLEQIEDKLHAKGVQNYRLELADIDEATEGKVIGSCNGGTKKVVYTRAVPVPPVNTAQSAVSAQ